MKKILILNQSSNYLTADIANAFAESGNYDNITLMLGNPDDVKALLNNSVNIPKVHRYNANSITSRLYSWILCTIQAIWFIKTRYRKYELFLVSNPATSSFIRMLCNNRYSSLTYDLFPDGFLDSGKLSEDNFIYKIWAKNNCTFFKNANHVYAITDTMADVMAKYVQREKIEVIKVID